MKTESVSLVAIFAAQIAALGLIPPVAIPVAGGVPITAQTLGVMLTALVLGPRLGTLAVLSFIFLVLLGIPMLSGGRGGLELLLAPSVGFLLGWLPACFVSGWLFHKLPGKRALWGRAVLSCFVGCVVVLYSFGILGLVVMAGLSLKAAIIGSLVFIPGDLIKSAVAATVLVQIAKAKPSFLRLDVAVK